jgi:glutamate-1-semialdehyde aminotransferase
MTSQERCAFFNSGTEAVMVATRLARAATGKNKTVIFEGAYHGTLDALLVMKRDPFSQKATANIPGITNAQVQDTYLLKFGDPASLAFISEHADEIAAVLTEAVQSRHPELVDPLFLEQLQGICKQNNIAFILDEIITGFRLCNGGAKKYFGLDPDITTYGKVLGGGFPIGVVAGRKKYLDYIDGGEWHFNDDSEPCSPSTFVAGTFCNHPMAMAASKATLEYLSDHADSIQESLNEKTGNLCRSINEFCSKQNYPLKLVHFGSLFRFVVTGKNRFIYQSLLKEKIYLWEGKTCFISTAHGEKEIERLEKGIMRSLVEHAASGLIRPEVNKIFTPVHSHLTCELLVDGELNPELLALAFNFVMINAETVTDHPFTYNFKEDPDGSKEKPSSVELSTMPVGNKTMLRLAVDRNLFDGWSIIAILRTLGRSYESLSNAKALPLEPFKDTVLLRKSLGPVKKSHPTVPADAEVVCMFIPSQKVKIDRSALFECLITRFARSIGKDELTIGVPVSGQLLSRRLKAIGNYSCHIPVSINCSLPEADCREQIRKQMEQGKMDFDQWFSGKKRTDHRFVFNLDNVQNDFRFGSSALSFEKIIDNYTNYIMVCNVVADPSGLHVSIKYDITIGKHYAKTILNQFSDLIIQFEPDEYSLSK